MVVLVVGLSLGGYILYKIFGASAGTVLGGILGGMISSTATTVTYSRRSADNPAHCIPALLVIVIAGTVVYARLLTEISLVAPGFLPHAAPPLLIMLGTAAALAIIAWVLARGDAGRLPEPGNPTQLRSALVFAGLYALVTLAVAAGEHFFKDRGLYVVAAISGLTDMDAITLSTSRLVNDNTVKPESGWRAILIASISNLVFKSGIVAWLGGPRLFRMFAAAGVVQALVALILILVW
jgi:uncharacterized membrane protein (DUF4010 family)